MAYSRATGSQDALLYPVALWNGELRAETCRVMKRDLLVQQDDGDDHFDFAPGCSINPSPPLSLGAPGQAVASTFHSGQPSPTCIFDCGHLCSGFQCSTVDPAATINPDFYDPADPRSPQNPTNPDFLVVGVCVKQTVTSCNTDQSLRHSGP